MTEFRIITTFGKRQWDAYARELLPRSLALWGDVAQWQIWLDEEIEGLPKGPDYRLLSSDEQHQDFMLRWHRLCVRYGQPSSYLHDAGRFAHKVFAMTSQAAQSNCEYMLFLGADVETTARIDRDWLHSVVRNADLVHLGRTDIASSETDFLSFHIGKNGGTFGAHALAMLRNVYVSGDLFRYPEWIDGYVIARIAAMLGEIAPFGTVAPIVRNLSNGLRGLDVWPHTVLGERMRHHKGPVGKAKLVSALENKT